MGHGIEPRSTPRRSVRRSERCRPSTDPRTVPAVVRQRIDATPGRRTADGLPGRKAGRHRKEGRVWRRRPAGPEGLGHRDRLTR